MLVRQAFRYELAPTAVQRTALANYAGAARWAWNWGLAVRRKAYRRRGETLTAVDLHRLLNRLKRTPTSPGSTRCPSAPRRRPCATWAGPMPTIGVGEAVAGGSACHGSRSAGTARSGSG
jgi:Helix-turn-helix domain